MDRRGFFSKLFNSSDMPGKIFFGLQIVLNECAKDGLRGDLHALLESQTEENRPAQRKAFYKTLSSKLLEVMFAAEYGFWDYIPDGNASEEYYGWVSELESSIASETDEFGESVDEQYRISSEKNYIAVSAIFLIDGSESNSAFYSAISQIPEDEYFDKASFQKLTEALRLIDFENVEGDAVFLIPGNDQDGLSWIDVHSEGWNYLKPIL